MEGEEKDEQQIYEEFNEWFIETGKMEEFKKHVRKNILKLLINPPPEPKPIKPEIKLLNELIREYLLYIKLYNTEFVFQADANLDAPMSRQEVAKKLGMMENRNSLNLPLLAYIIEYYVDSEDFSNSRNRNLAKKSTESTSCKIIKSNKSVIECSEHDFMVILATDSKNKAIDTLSNGSIKNPIKSHKSTAESVKIPAPLIDSVNSSVDQVVEEEFKDLIKKWFRYPNKRKMKSVLQEIKDTIHKPTEDLQNELVGCSKTQTDLGECSYRCTDAVNNSKKCTDSVQYVIDESANTSTAESSIKISSIESPAYLIYDSVKDTFNESSRSTISSPSYIVYESTNISPSSIADSAKHPVGYLDLDLSESTTITSMDSSTDHDLSEETTTNTIKSFDKPPVAPLNINFSGSSTITSFRSSIDCFDRDLSKHAVTNSIRNSDKYSRYKIIEYVTEPADVDFIKSSPKYLENDSQSVEVLGFNSPEGMTEFSDDSVEYFADNSTNNYSEDSFGYSDNEFLGKCTEDLENSSLEDSLFYSENESVEFADEESVTSSIDLNESIEIDQAEEFVVEENENLVEYSNNDVEEYSVNDSDNASQHDLDEISVNRSSNKLNTPSTKKPVKYLITETIQYIVDDLDEELINRLKEMSREDIVDESDEEIDDESDTESLEGSEEELCGSCRNFYRKENH